MTELRKFLIYLPHFISLNIYSNLVTFIDREIFNSNLKNYFIIHLGLIFSVPIILNICHWSMHIKLYLK